MKEALLQIYVMDLQKVIKEVEGYDSEGDMWVLEEGISNSAGNLALHLIGNLNHFFGKNLGNSGYLRKRDEEFSGTDVSREEIIQGLEDCISMLKSVFGSLSDNDLEKDYPEEFGGEVRTIGTIVVYMLSHLNYHLGQINYHRRLLGSK